MYARRSRFSAGLQLSMRILKYLLMKCTEHFPMKTTHDNIEQTATRCGTKKARNDDRITLAKYYVDEIHGDKMGVACNTPKRDEKCTQQN